MSKPFVCSKFDKITQQNTFFKFTETSQGDGSDEDAGVMKTNTKKMTFYHCLFGGYGFVSF